MPFEYIIVIIVLILILYAFKQNTSITDDSVDIDEDIVVVCSSCNPDLLAAKTSGIKEAMRRLSQLLGGASHSLPPNILPITFHLDGDSFCGPYRSGLTGNFSRDASGLGHVCLWDVEKERRFRPFTIENAQKIEDQLLPIHEAMHGWFVGRQNNYRIQEPFCKLISFIISEFPDGPEYCWRFSKTPDSHPDVLMKYLCEIGMTSQLAVEILKKLSQSATIKGTALSDLEFSGIVTSILEKDSVPAFQSAGILPR